jgi:hypothetical protein
MAVYQHRSNTPSRRQFLVTNEVERAASTSYLLIDWVVNELGQEVFKATQSFPLPGLSLTEWELSLDFTGALAVFHRYIRS